MYSGAFRRLPPVFRSIPVLAPVFRCLHRPLYKTIYHYRLINSGHHCLCLYVAVVVSWSWPWPWPWVCVVKTVAVAVSLGDILSQLAKQVTYSICCTCNGYLHGVCSSRLSTNHPDALIDEPLLFHARQLNFVISVTFHNTFQLFLPLTTVNKGSHVYVLSCIVLFVTDLRIGNIILLLSLLYFVLIYFAVMSNST